VGVIAEEVGVPRYDGTSMSSFYRVPLKLSRPVTPEWETLFERTWNHSPRFSALRRASIARVDHDRIILSCTTLEEVLNEHKAVLIACAVETNRLLAEKVAERELKAAESQRARAEHQRKIEEMKGKLRFD
jgi:hypothetical protein